MRPRGRIKLLGWQTAIYDPGLMQDLDVLDQSASALEVMNQQLFGRD